MKWADWVRDRVKPKLDSVFLSDENGRPPAVYFWARTMVCPNPACQAEIPLLSSFWLANSARHKAWVEVSGRPGKIDLGIRIGAPPAGTQLSDGTVKASSVTCPGCGTSMIAKEVREYATKVGFGHILYAVLDIDRQSQNVSCADRRGDRACRKAGHSTPGRAGGDAGRDIGPARRADGEVAVPLATATSFTA